MNKIIIESDFSVNHQYYLFWDTTPEARNLWPVATGVALELFSNRKKVQVPKYWDFMFGRQLTGSDDLSGWTPICISLAPHAKSSPYSQFIKSGKVIAEIGYAEIPFQIEHSQNDRIFKHWEKAELDFRRPALARPFFEIAMGELPEASKMLSVDLAIGSDAEQELGVWINDQKCAVVRLNNEDAGWYHIEIQADRFKEYQQNKIAFEIVEWVKVENTKDAKPDFRFKNLKISSQKNSSR